MPLLCFSSPFNKTLNNRKIRAFLLLPVVHPNIPTSSPFNCSCRGRSRITAALQGKKLEHKTTRITHWKWKRHLGWGNNCCWHRMDCDIPTTTTHVIKINGCEIRSWPQCPQQLRRRSFHTSVPWRMVGLKKWGIDLVAKKNTSTCAEWWEKKRTCRCQKMNWPWFFNFGFHRPFETGFYAAGKARSQLSRKSSEGKSHQKLEAYGQWKNDHCLEYLDGHWGKWYLIWYDKV